MSTGEIIYKLDEELKKKGTSVSKELSSIAKGKASVKNFEKAVEFKTKVDEAFVKFLAKTAIEPETKIVTDAYLRKNRNLERRSFTEDHNYAVDDFVSPGDTHRPTSYSSLAYWAKSPIVANIIKTRIRQVMNFTMPSENPFKKGFQVVEASNYYGNTPTIFSEKYTNFILNCGTEAMSHQKKDSFQDFISSIVIDSLTYDQAVFEIIYDVETGAPACFTHVPADTIEILSRQGAEKYKKLMEGKRRGKGLKPLIVLNGEVQLPKYAQVINGQIKSVFYEWELCFGVRFKDPSLRAGGYGVSEIQQCINNLSNLRSFDIYNTGSFKNYNNTKCIIHIQSDGGGGRSLKDEMSSTIGGYWDAGKIPVFMTPDEIKVISLDKSDDLEYRSFFMYNLGIVATAFGMSIQELGFHVEREFNPSVTTRGQQGERDYSIEKGLNPLLTHIEGWINKKILFPKTKGKYIFRFTGKDQESIFNMIDMCTKAVGSFMTVNEVRKLVKESLGTEGALTGGDTPVNAALIGQSNRFEDTYLQAAQMPDPAEGGAPGQSTPGSKPTNSGNSKMENTARNSGKDASDANANKKTRKERGITKSTQVFDKINGL